MFKNFWLKTANFCTNNLDKLTTSIANVDISCVFQIILCTINPYFAIYIKSRLYIQKLLAKNSRFLHQ